MQAKGLKCVSQITALSTQLPRTAVAAQSDSMQLIRLNSNSQQTTDLIQLVQAPKETQLDSLPSKIPIDVSKPTLDSKQLFRVVKLSQTTNASHLLSKLVISQANLAQHPIPVTISQPIANLGQPIKTATVSCPKTETPQLSKVAVVSQSATHFKKSTGLDTESGLSIHSDRPKPISQSRTEAGSMQHSGSMVKHVKLQNDDNEAKMNLSSQSHLEKPGPHQIPSKPKYYLKSFNYI